MIRITIEMVPGGVESLKRHMATILIANDGDHPNRATRGNYSAVLSRISHRGAYGPVWKTTEVKDFPRAARTVYDLLYQVLRNVVGDRNGAAGPDLTELEIREEVQERVLPHSRACGFQQHEHGPACSPNCPTCRGGEY